MFDFCCRNITLRKTWILCLFFIGTIKTLLDTLDSSSIIYSSVTRYNEASLLLAPTNLNGKNNNDPSFLFQTLKSLFLHQEVFAHGLLNDDSISSSNNVHDNIQESTTTLIEQQQQKHLTKAVIGYAISITSCDSNTKMMKENSRANLNPLLDAAAVLSHSIHLSSIRNSNSNSQYDYALYAFVHPDAMNCTQDLNKFGYTVQRKDTPIQVSDIQNEELKGPVNGGCCGAKEFLKLYALELIDHPIAVHLDLDTIILKPMDPLFDAMLLPDDDANKPTPFAMWGNNNTSNSTNKKKITSHPIHSYFTRDYPMRMGRRIQSNNYGSTAMQGGFWVVKPSLKVLEELKSLILSKDNGFIPGLGWGGTTVNADGSAWQYGVPQFQGLMSYYYTHVQPHTSVELNRCYYNTLVDDPKTKFKLSSGEEKTICTTGQSECQDCRKTNFSSVYSAHYAYCLKPWMCTERGRSDPSYSLCHQLLLEWHKIRRDLEIKSGMLSNAVFGKRIEMDAKDIRKQHCNKTGFGGYVPMKFQN